MQNEIVDFRYSDRDFIAYLMTIGMKYTHIEVAKDRSGKPKAFVYFRDTKDNLIKLLDEYKNNSITINLNELATNKGKIHKILKAEILKYQANNL